MAGLSRVPVPVGALDNCVDELMQAAVAHRHAWLDRVQTRLLPAFQHAQRMAQLLLRQTLAHAHQILANPDVPTGQWRTQFEERAAALELACSRGLPPVGKPRVNLLGYAVSEHWTCSETKGDLALNVDVPGNFVVHYLAPGLEPGDARGQYYDAHGHCRCDTCGPVARQPREASEMFKGWRLGALLAEPELDCFKVEQTWRFIVAPMNANVFKLFSRLRRLDDGPQAEGFGRGAGLITCDANVARLARSQDFLVMQLQEWHGQWELAPSVVE